MLFAEGVFVNNASTEDSGTEWIMARQNAMPNCINNYNSSLASIHNPNMELIRSLESVLKQIFPRMVI